MSTGNVERCFSFISCQLGSPAREARYRPENRLRPAVTISRQTGSGAMTVATLLADYLQAHAPVDCPWAVFDKNLVEEVLEEHNLPKELAKFMPEDRVSAIQDAVEEVLGLHPPSWTLLRQTTETILHLAELGNVILVGRASNVITRQLKNVFHVRLVAPLEARLEQVLKTTDMNRDSALSFIKKEDAGRTRYLKRYFKADLDDPLLYDLVLNTERLPHPDAAQLIGEAVLRWARQL